MSTYSNEKGASRSNRILTHLSKVHLLLLLTYVQCASLDVPSFVLLSGNIVFREANLASAYVAFIARQGNEIWRIQGNTLYITAIELHQHRLLSVRVRSTQY